MGWLSLHTNAFMSNVDHAAMVDGDILLFTLPQSAYIYRKSRTAHAPSNFLEVGVRLLETGEDAAIRERNFRSRLYLKPRLATMTDLYDKKDLITVSRCRESTSC